MKILFLGDIFGTAGRAALTEHLPGLKQKLAPDVVIVNGENAAANGRGITPETLQEIFNAGVDVVTLGDHTFDQKGVEELLTTHARPSGRLIRPANYPAGTMGKGHTVHTVTHGPHAGQKVAVINLQGRVFMKDNIDCPFQTSRRLMQEYILGETADAIVVDIHCEATSEKCNMGHLWDGAASLVVGTHTHIPTSDTRIQPKGTAYQTDAGMCGNYASSLGVDFATSLPNFERKGRLPFQPASGPATLSGILVETGPNGLATTAQPVRHGGVLSPT